MDKQELIRTFAAGVLAKVTEEAIELLQKEAAKDGITIDSEHKEILEVGVGMGAAVMTNYLYRNGLLKENVVTL